MADPQKAHEVTPQEAISQYSEAVKVNDGDAEAHFNLATAFYAARDYSAARHELEQSLRLDDHNFHAHYYLGAVSAHQGDQEKARQEWERVVNEAQNTMLRAQARGQLSAVQPKT